jgi:LPS-assembly protein
VSDEASFVEQRQLEWGYGARFTRNWSGFYDERYDIRREESRTKAAGLEYRDDCTLFRVFWERENFQIGDLGPSESVKFEFVLFTLGGVAED